MEFKPRYDIIIMNLTDLKIYGFNFWGVGFVANGSRIDIENNSIDINDRIYTTQMVFNE